MNFHVVTRPTQFTPLSEKPLFEFCSVRPENGGLIVDDCLTSPLERDASPLGNKRFLSFALDGDLESFVGFPIACPARFIFLVDLFYGQLEFCCQRFC